MSDTELKYRSMVLERTPLEEKQTYEISFSSDAPIQMPGGVEVLMHDPGCCHTTRLENGILPLLMNHDHNKIIGKVLNGWIDHQSRKGRAVIVFSDSSEGQKARDLFEEDILTSVSFGYRVYQAREQGGTSFVSSWEPYEISLVATPADISVGKGRNFNSHEETKIMPSATRRTASEKSEALEAYRAEFREEESLRIRGITQLADRYSKQLGGRAQELATQLIDAGVPITRARSAFLDELEEETFTPIASGSPTPIGSVYRSMSGRLDLTPREISRYSLLNAIQAQVLGDWSKAGFERECSQELAKRGLKSNGLLIPLEALKTRAPAVTTVPAYAGSLVETQIDDASFISALRNRLAMTNLGVSIMDGCQGNVAIPRQGGVSALGWIAENTDLPESNPTFDLVNLTPKTVGAWTAMSRQVLTQSSIDLENLVRQDFASQLAVQLDQTMVHGTGASNQPRGILATAGITSIAMGTNGGPATYSSVLDLEAALANKNADTGSMGWLTSPKLRKSLKNTLVAASAGSDFIWRDSSMGDGMGSILGYKAMATTSVRSDLTKGAGTNLSALIFGNWAGFVMASWGALSLEVDPFADFRKGTVAVRVLMFADMALRNPESFAVISDATTP